MPTVKDYQTQISIVEEEIRDAQQRLKELRYLRDQAQLNENLSKQWRLRRLSDDQIIYGPCAYPQIMEWVQSIAEFEKFQPEQPEARGAFVFMTWGLGAAYILEPTP